MPTCFHGLRRKLGVVTLLLSCFSMVGWVRSFTFNEGVMTQFRENWTDEFASYDSSLIWACTRKGVTSRLVTVLFSNRRFGDDGVWKWEFAQWRWKSLGFGYGSDGGGAKTIGIMTIHTAPSTVTVVPYWSLVLPFTALSAYLLLSKQRTPRQKRLTEPIPTERA